MCGFANGLPLHLAVAELPHAFDTVYKIDSSDGLSTGWLKNQLDRSFDGANPDIDAQEVWGGIGSGIALLSDQRYSIGNRARLQLSSSCFC